MSKSRSNGGWGDSARIVSRPHPAEPLIGVSPEMVAFVRTFIEQHDPYGTPQARRYPFRRRFEHCYRCCVWANRISANEGGDREIIAVAALFHDIGKSMVRGKQRHAQLGARICTEYLASTGYPPDRIGAIAAIVADHVNHHNPGSHEACVVSDADELDEIGALSVLRDTMVSGAEGAKSYQEAYRRLQRAHQKMVRKEPCLHTLTAQSLYEERMRFVEGFIRQLETELGHNDQDA